MSLSKVKLNSAYKQKPHKSGAMSPPLPPPKIAKCSRFTEEVTAAIRLLFSSNLVLIRQKLNCQRVLEFFKPSLWKGDEAKCLTPKCLSHRVQGWSCSFAAVMINWSSVPPPTLLKWKYQRVQEVKWQNCPISLLICSWIVLWLRA